MPKYIALQSVGSFLPGEEIKGLNADRIQALLASGAIEEFKAPEQKLTDNSTAELEKLKSDVADLKVANQQLETEKTAALNDVADLKAKIVKLENDLAAVVAKPVEVEKITAKKGAQEAK